jgi:hypothetical protein
MSRKITRESWDFSYCGRDDDHEDIKRFNLSFENPEDDEEIVRQLTTFLQASGRNKISVSRI